MLEGRRHGFLSIEMDGFAMDCDGLCSSLNLLQAVA